MSDIKTAFFHALVNDYDKKLSPDFHGTDKVGYFAGKFCRYFAPIRIFGELSGTAQKHYEPNVHVTHTYGDIICGEEHQPSIYSPDYNYDHSDHIGETKEMQKRIHNFKDSIGYMSYENQTTYGKVKPLTAIGEVTARAAGLAATALLLIGMYSAGKDISDSIGKNKPTDSEPLEKSPITLVYNQ